MSDGHGVYLHGCAADDAALAEFGGELVQAGPERQHAVRLVDDFVVASDENVPKMPGSNGTAIGPEPAQRLRPQAVGELGVDGVVGDRQAAAIADVPSVDGRVRARLLDPVPHTTNGSTRASTRRAIAVPG